MIKLSEEAMSKADVGQKLGSLRQTISQVVNAKENVWKYCSPLVKEWFQPEVLRFKKYTS